MQSDPGTYRRFVSAELQTARSYFQVDRIILALERFLSNSVRSVSGYSAEALRKRLAQAVVMHMTDPFLRMRLQRDHPEEQAAPSELPMEFFVGELKINTGTGASQPSTKLLVLCVAKYLALWALVLLHYCRAQFSWKDSIGKATMLHGVPYADLSFGGTTHRFEEYCRKGNLKALREASSYVVQATKPVVTERGSEFIYCQYPLLKLFSGNRLSIKEGWVFLCCHFGSLFAYAGLLWRVPISCLLWRDFAEHAAAWSLNRRHLIEANLITNTNWLQQFLWMTSLPDRSFSTYIALYSLNSSRLVFKTEPTGCGEHPGLRHLTVDCALIWHEFYQSELRRLGVRCETKVVGPILWYLPADEMQRSQGNGAWRICVFDVTPKTAEALARVGMADNYYNAETMKKFLDDVLVVATGMASKSGHEVEVILKHKRERMSWNDEGYYCHIDGLLNANSIMQLASEDSNLYNLVSGCDLVIVIPYSSPAYIAAHVDIPAIYYDPTGELDLGVHADLKVPLVKFASGALQLADMAHLELLDRTTRNDFVGEVEKE